MADLITISQFNELHEAYIAKSQLELAGIESFLLNENTFSNNLNHLATSKFLQLQVEESNVRQAVMILLENKIIRPEDVISDIENVKISAFLKISNKIPIIKNLELQHRVFALLAAVAISLSLIILLISSLYEHYK